MRKDILRLIVQMLSGIAILFILIFLGQKLNVYKELHYHFLMGLIVGSVSKGLANSIF